MEKADVLMVMVNAAMEAGASLRMTNQGSLRVATKNNDVKNIVTQADVLSEKIIREHLTRVPDFAIIGEEGTDVPGERGTFYVDPLDGTIPFAAAMPTYAVSIGLVQNNVPTHGVLYYPADRELIIADPEYGTNRGFAAFSAKAPHDLVVGFDYSLGMDREKQALDYYVPLLNATRYVYTFACVTWGVRLLIEGKIDAYVHPGATRFDWAAAAAIITAMGGFVQNFEGQPLDFTQRRVPAIATRDAQTMTILQKIFNK